MYRFEVHATSSLIMNTASSALSRLTHFFSLSSAAAAAAAAPGPSPGIIGLNGLPTPFIPGLSSVGSSLGGGAGVLLDALSGDHPPSTTTVTATTTTTATGNGNGKGTGAPFSTRVEELPDGAGDGDGASPPLVPPAPGDKTAATAAPLRSSPLRLPRFFLPGGARTRGSGSGSSSSGSGSGSGGGNGGGGGSGGPAGPREPPTERDLAWARAAAAAAAAAQEQEDLRRKMAKLFG